jgi:glutaminyl-tRNA synthetase
MNNEKTESTDFIRTIVREDIAAGKNDGKVHTRFPPEPNGYLHIGHAKAFLLSYNIAQEFGGTFNLRYDDTNPIKEEQEYIDAIEKDLRWLGCDWGDRLYHASDYFEQLYEWGLQLIRDGKAFVCELTGEQVRIYRGTLTEPGEPSPWRDRPLEESLDLFKRMRAGEFEDGNMTLRAKIDMAAPNLNLRDPVIYRILHATHPRVGDDWCVYPMYDFTHGQSDAIEGITHSLCSLEFEDHRPLYDWFIQNLDVPHEPRQIEFARLNLSYTVVTKRKLLQLVEQGQVSGWDDPRMPTLCGMRRRGFTPASIRNFIDRIGLAKRASVVDVALLEHSVREDLNKHTQRVMGVLDPLKVVIENYPEDTSEELPAVNNPEDPSMGSRSVPFSRELYIERADFMEEPPKKFFRLAPGREVRLRYAYFITCNEVIKNDAGEVVELRCSYDPSTRGGDSPDGRKVKATLHWVSASHSLPAEVRLYDRLFDRENPLDEKDGDFTSHLNPDSLTVLKEARVEPFLADAQPGDRVQLERQGYFCVDSEDSKPGALVLNRTVPLRDTWARIAKRQGK